MEEVLDSPLDDEELDELLEENDLLEPLLDDEDLDELLEDEDERESLSDDELEEEEEELAELPVDEDPLLLLLPRLVCFCRSSSFCCSIRSASPFLLRSSSGTTTVPTFALLAYFSGFASNCDRVGLER